MKTQKQVKESISTNDTILAKTKPKESLGQHTRKVLKALKSIIRLYPNIHKVAEYNTIKEDSKYSAILHDTGKGAIGCQEQMETKVIWNLRHELLSAAIAYDFLDISEERREMICVTIATHHKSLTKLRDYADTDNKGIEGWDDFVKEMQPYWSEIKRVVDKLCKKEGLTSLHLPEKLTSLKDPYPVLKKFDNNPFRENTIRKEGFFMKGLLTGADHLASYGLTTVKQIKNFPHPDFDLNIVQKKVQNISNGVVIAPTGYGKTEVAMKWFEAQHQFGGRLFYTLPNNASINRMYETLNVSYGNGNVQRYHGKIRQILFNQLMDEKYEDKTKKIRQEISLYKKIHSPIKVTTIFQLLKNFFQVKGFEQRLVEMTNACIVIDEIHVYDAHITALLLTMLEELIQNYNVKVLVMSATIPSFLLKLLKQIGITNLIRVDKTTLKKIRRHRINIKKGSLDEGIDLIIKAIRKGERVLIIRNHVKEAQQIFEKIEKLFPRKAMLLHGKYTRQGRVDAEKELDKKQILIGTQVVEVSLNISYDTLFTDVAPLGALLQRFGRVGRTNGINGRKQTEPAIVNIFSETKNASKWIYDEALVIRTLNVLRTVDIIDESLIQDMIDKVYDDEYVEKYMVLYNDKRNAFKKHLKNMRPFINDEKSKKVFYELFNGIDVVPYCYKDIYLENIKDKKYLEADKYLVQISYGAFNKLFHENRVEIIKTRRINVYIINAKYDTKLGLLIDETEYDENSFSHSSI